MKQEYVKRMKVATHRFKNSQIELLKFQHSKRALAVKQYQTVWDKCKNMNWLFRQYYLLNLQGELGMHIWGFIFSVIFGVIAVKAHEQIGKVELLAQFSGMINIALVLIAIAPAIFALYVLFSAESEFSHYLKQALEDEEESFEILKKEIQRQRANEKGDK